MTSPARYGFVSPQAVVAASIRRRRKCRTSAAASYATLHRTPHYVADRFIRLRAFSDARCKCAAIFGNRFSNFLSRLCAQTYSVDRIIRPISRKRTPCRIGRNNPAMPRRMNPQPLNNSNHRLRFWFNWPSPVGAAKFRATRTNLKFTALKVEGAQLDGPATLLPGEPRTESSGGSPASTKRGVDCSTPHVTQTLKLRTTPVAWRLDSFRTSAMLNVCLSEIQHDQPRLVALVSAARL